MIRLINTTTRLPVDQSLEDSFFGLIKPAYSNAVSEQRHRRHDHIDVQFVSKDDLDLDRRRLRQLEDEPTETDCDDRFPDMDLLGVYFPHHPDYHRPVIKVSPEKVMAACQLLKTKTDIKLSLIDLYPTLLHAVVIHELAHSLMDSDSSGDHCDTPWNWLANCLEEVPKRHYHENLDHYFESHHCHSSRTIPQKLRQWRHIIEESLANAFVLKQGFNAEQLAALTLFIKSQPPAYKAGLKWKCTLPKLLETAKSWSRFKSDGFRSQWDLLYSEVVVKSTLEILADRLTEVEIGQEDGALIYLHADYLKESESIGAVDFKKDFHRYLVSRLPVWQATFEKDGKKWGDFLNGTFGVLWHLASDVKSTNQEIKFLQQQANNLSTGAADVHANVIDKINDILFKASMDKGNYQKALKFQHLRLNNFSKTWLSKHASGPRVRDEIEKSITELSARLNLSTVTKP